ncbi:hypothetical protein [Actinoplanes sp. NPDC026619]|uniref:LLM class flavin-dependent oxidoreductase n=1 Tax=Actinoplanes sp. NPDC026619 TaxID=3155798 RepID=UPI0033F9502F
MRLYSVSPDLRAGGHATVGATFTDAARGADRAGLDGMLIDTGGTAMEPWSVAQYLVERTERLTPLVTVEPADMHPYMTARMVSGIAAMHGRRVDFTLVADSTLGHDENCDRLVAYGRIMKALLRADDPLTFDSRHYRLADAVIYPSLPPRLVPRIFVAGQEPAAATVARELGVGQLIDLPGEADLTVRPPRPRSAVRAGIIARDTSEQAWRVARERAGRPAHGLVGSHAEVVAALTPYQQAGVAAVVMTNAVTEDDLGHAMTVMRAVRENARGRVDA